MFYAERVLNRLAMLLMLTAFSLVLLAWLLSAGGALADWNKCFRITFVVVNIVRWSFRDLLPLFKRQERVIGGKNERNLDVMDEPCVVVVTA